MNINIENNGSNGMVALSKKQPIAGFMSPNGPQEDLNNLPFKTDSKTEEQKRKANKDRQPRSRAEIEKSMRELPPFQDLSNINVIKNPYYMCRKNLSS